MAPILCDRCGSDTVVSRASARAEEETDGHNLLYELSQLDDLLVHLTIKRCHLKRKINQFFIPIVRLLPPDVMSIIFGFYLPDFADFQPLPSRLDLYGPLSLGAVCSYWREIAWSTPSLWSSLMVHVIPSKCDSHTAIAQEWLARSGQLPLSIRIFSKAHTPVPRTMHQAVSALAHIINQYSTRWSDFDLCVPRSLYQYFRATNNHAPILKSIRFHPSNNIEGDDNMGSFQLTCPRLRKASLSFLWVDRIDIQWENITHLYLKDMLIHDCFLILRKTPRLLFCAFSRVLGFTSLSAVGAPVLPPLRSLRSFYILDTFEGFEDLMNFLQSIPSLKKLSITATNLYSPPGFPGTRNILQVVAKVLSSQSAIPQQGFLPNLEILEYTGKPRLGPGNYADLYSLPPAENAVQGPLQLVKLDLYPAILIPPNTISFFLSLVERGITVNVLSKSQDILQSSINYYRDREESLRRCPDWIDDLDLSLMQDLL